MFEEIFFLAQLLMWAEPGTVKLPCADSQHPSFLLGAGKKPQSQDLFCVKDVWMGVPLDSFTKENNACEG